MIKKNQQLPVKYDRNRTINEGAMRLTVIILKLHKG